MPTCDNVLLELTELRKLDVSEEKDAYAFEIFGSTAKVQFLSFPDSLPNLTSLDISGNNFFSLLLCDQIYCCMCLGSLFHWND